MVYIQYVEAARLNQKLQEQTLFQLLLQKPNHSQGKHVTLESIAIFDTCFTITYPSFIFGPYSCKKDNLDTSKNLQTYNRKPYVCQKGFSYHLRTEKLCKISILLTKITSTNPFSCQAHKGKLKGALPIL